jgi:hypothetical protein
MLWSGLWNTLLMSSLWNSLLYNLYWLVYKLLLVMLLLCRLRVRWHDLRVLRNLW